jgi:hypothetical protein
MSVTSMDAQLAERASFAGARSLATPLVQRALLSVGVFGLYWFSAVILQARDATLLFGADAHLYSMLYDGTPVDRVTRFHPLTTVLGAIWMKALAPLTYWMTPQVLFKGMFAAVGAAGVWWAMAAFAAIGPRRHVLLWGVIYASSLGVWFFSSIEESKIVTATLAAFYIATYLRLRTAWTLRGALLLTAILLLSCLNEIVGIFMVAIPAVDAMVQKGWDIRYHLRHNWWIACHALAGPLAFLILEFVVNGWMVPAGNDPEGSSHLSMLFYYVIRNDYGGGALYTFAARWFFFNLAAPSLKANYGAGGNYMGDFAPVLSNYFNTPVSTAMVLLFGAILAVSFISRHRGTITRDAAGIMLGLAAYALLRMLFFLMVHPGECLLFASGVTLPHMLLVAIPFAASSYPRKQMLLAGLAATLFVVNGTFIVGP